MTSDQLDAYKVLIYVAYKDYVNNLINKTKVSRLNLKHELDTRVWVLRKVVKIIVSFEYNDRNYYDSDEMLQWQGIMNDIMGTKLYVDFKVS